MSTLCTWLRQDTLVEIGKVKRDLEARGLDEAIVAATHAYWVGKAKIEASSWAQVEPATALRLQKAVKASACHNTLDGLLNELLDQGRWSE